METDIPKLHLIGKLSPPDPPYSNYTNRAWNRSAIKCWREELL